MSTPRKNSISIDSLEQARAFLARAEPAVDTILDGIGALNLFEDGGVDSVIYDLENGKLQTDLLSFVEKRHDRTLDCLLSDAMHERMRISYLLGLAVGRRLGGAR